MKNFFPLLFLAIFSAPVLNAQVLEETRVMVSGSQPALTIVLPGASAKFVETKWKEYMKEYGKVTRVKSASESVVSDVQIIDIGGVNKLDIYSLVEEGSDGAKMVVWIDTGTGFINSEANPKEYVSTVKFLKDFSQKVKVDQVTMELEEQEKLLSKAENNLDKLKRENENLHKVIEDSKKRIAQAENDIEKNLKDQETAHKEIEAQKEAVGTVKQKLEECKKQ